MRTILHILTRPEDELSRTVMAGQRALPEVAVETIDLACATPDYNVLVEKIFSADSVEVW
jgi:hypothetical protein